MTAEKNRFEHSSGYVAREIKRLTHVLEGHIDKLEVKEAAHNTQRHGERSDGVEESARIAMLENAVACYAVAHSATRPDHLKRGAPSGGSFQGTSSE
jgi:hypothetical protein